MAQQIHTSSKIVSERVAREVLFGLAGRYGRRIAEEALEATRQGGAIMHPSWDYRPDFVRADELAWRGTLVVYSADDEVYHLALVRLEDGNFRLELRWEEFPEESRYFAAWQQAEEAGEELTRWEEQFPQYV